MVAMMVVMASTVSGSSTPSRAHLPRPARGDLTCEIRPALEREIDERFPRDQIKLVDEETFVKPKDSTPKRPRDVIDFVEEFCGQKGNVAEVSPEYYDAFLTLSDAEMDVLAHAVLNAQAKESRRLTFAEPAAEAPTRLLEFASNTIFAIAIGLARFSNFAQLGLYKRVGPEPEPDVHDALTERIAKARPVIELAVRDFIQQHHDAPTELGLAATKPDAKPIQIQNPPNRTIIDRRTE